MFLTGIRVLTFSQKLLLYCCHNCGQRIYNTIQTTNYPISCDANYFIIFNMLKNDKVYNIFILIENNTNTN